MITNLRFYKIQNEWFADVPGYLDNKGTSLADLQMVVGADKWLNKLSKGKEEITLKIANEKIEAETGRLFNIDIEGIGWYMEFPSLSRMWLCEVTIYIFKNGFPEIIYYKII